MTSLTFSKSSPASETVTYSITTPTTRTSTFALDAAPPPRKSSKDVEKAVYAYLRALRALGQTELKVSEVAEGLHIAVPLVISALNALRRKGVKFG